MERKSNNVDIKKINRNRVYQQVIGHETISKPEIAQALGISMPTVMQNINELIERGLVEEVGDFASTGGRKAKALSPVYSAAGAIGVDLTQNHLGMVYTDLSGEVLAHKRIFKPYEDTDNYYRELAEQIEIFIEEEKVPQDTLLGTGISIPGIVDQERNWINSSYVLGVEDIPCELISQYIPYDAVFINDANAAALAETHSMKSGENVIYLSLSNSVGGAVISGDLPGYEEAYGAHNIYVGDNWKGSEFGHITLYPNGDPCYCGKHGCMDAYCSAKKLARYTGNRLESFFEELEKGSQELEAVWDEYLDNLAISANNLRMIFDCRIIIGGYVGSFMEPYLPILRQKMKERNAFETNILFVQNCRYRVEASALGAAILHIKNYIQSV